MEHHAEVTLGGRKLVFTEDEDLTFDQYAWLETTIEKAGLGQDLINLLRPIAEQVAAEEKPLSEEDVGRISRQITRKAMEQDAHLDLLVGMLVEPGTEWTRARAEELARFLRRVKGKDEIMRVQAVLGQIIVGFLQSGLASIVTSPSFSLLAEADPGSESVPDDGSESSGS